MNCNPHYTLPINHLSFSAMRDYLSDRAKFERQYIRLEYDTGGTPFAVALGSAFHKGVETLWQDSDPYRHEVLMRAKYVADEYLARIEHETKYGKTQSIDGGIQTVRKALSTYYENCMGSLGADGTGKRQPIGVEVGGLTDIFHPDTGEIYVVPLKCKIDQIFDDPDWGLVPVDSKLVSTIIPPDAPPPPAYELQAVAVYFMTKSLHPNRKVAPLVIFEQVSKTATPKVARLVVDITDTRIRRFSYIFGAIINDLTMHYHSPSYDPSDPTRVPFLPNPFADFGGAESWEDYTFVCDGGKALAKPADI